MKKLLLFFMPFLMGGLTLCIFQQLRAQAPPQYPLADKVADKLIQKYQTSTCQQLAQEKQQQKQQPPSAEKSAMEQKAVEALHNDPKLRQHFLNKVAPPIVNKMFECRFIP